MAEFSGSEPKARTYSMKREQASYSEGRARGRQKALLTERGREREKGRRPSLSLFLKGKERKNPLLLFLEGRRGPLTSFAHRHDQVRGSRKVSSTGRRRRRRRVSGTTVCT